jgi:23S rRNA-/tRNA-specific pseudouridylate synthase
MQQEQEQEQGQGQPTVFCENQGRIYKCGGGAAPNSDKTHTIPLIKYLCTTKNGNFREAAWKRRILRGQISADGAFVNDPDFPLSPGCRVSYHRSPWIEPVINVKLPRTSRGSQTENLSTSEEDSNFDKDDPHSLHVIYEDEHLMAVHKPSGLPTMPSQTYFDYSVLNALRRSDRSSSSSSSFLAPPQPVHRLGVGTSGVLLIATSFEARNRLSAAIRDKNVKKVYRALVRGVDIPDIVEIDCPIGPVPFPIGGGTIHAACPIEDSVGENKDIRINMDATILSDASKKAKSALSIARVVRRNLEANTTVVEVEIPTGRPHQIRIHMAYVGHPLVGDPLYLPGGIPDCQLKLFPSRKKEDEDMDTDDEGEEECIEGADGDSNSCGGVMRVALPRDCGYSLHAYQMTVEHPTKIGERMTFTAKPPKHLMG